MSEAYDVEVRITPRKGILDPEGETIARALGSLGYEGVSRVRAGRLIRLRLEAATAEAARRSVEAMCEELIANPIIEDYSVAVRDEATGDGGAPTAGGDGYARDDRASAPGDGAGGDGRTADRAGGAS